VGAAVILGGLEQVSDLYCPKCDVHTYDVHHKCAPSPAVTDAVKPAQSIQDQAAELLSHACGDTGLQKGARMTARLALGRLVDGLVADSERLDWLDTISYATELAGGKDLWKVNLVVPRSEETDFRKLVDAARRNTGEDEPPIRSTVTVPEGRRRLRSGLPHDSEKK
jgi:hypothetical protein